VITDSFKGPSAVALSYDDPVAPAKVLSEFADANNKLELKVGVMNGKMLDLSALRALAVLPSREILLAKVLSAMNGVPTGFVRTLNGVPQKFLNLLIALRDQKEAA
jgi:large subunit ribosomal protein L10